MTFYECREFCNEHITLHHFQFTTIGFARYRRYHHRRHRHVEALKTMRNTPRSDKYKSAQCTETMD